KKEFSPEIEADFKPFEEPDDAMKAATKMLLAQLEATVQIRIGLHHGSFISGRGDIFSDAVNTAARLMGLAQPDEGIASAALAEQLSDELSEHLLPFDQQHLKGKADATVVYRLLPPDDDVTEMIPVKTQIRRQAQTATIQIRLEYAGQRVVLDESRPNITIGRADDAELHISSRRVSRAHAMIAVRDFHGPLHARHLDRLATERIDGASGISAPGRGGTQLPGCAPVGKGADNHSLLCQHKVS
ncbi:MAG: hypothetical protein CMQ61_01200, partial [Gammaproteobacteria bacterium]|nr:hypothetical protein [Gammaproteobacteria bacterium]